MARLSLRRKPVEAETLPPSEGPPSAAILAARFGVEHPASARSEARPGLLARWRRPAVDGGGGPRPPRPTGFLITSLVLVAGLAAVAGWLAGNADDTESRRVAAEQPRATADVLLPDGSKRFPDPVPAAEVAVDPVDMDVELSPSRNEALLERGRAGFLPKIGPDGLAPWQYYARPFPQNDPRPRIALVVTGMGQSIAQTESAIDRLPGVVTFSFVPQVAGLQDMIDRSRRDGHEVLLAVPMEPLGFPRNDPGPGALLTALSDEENVRRLEEVMAKATGYVGLTAKTDSGTKFLTRRESVDAILAQVKRRGLMFFDLWQVRESFATRVADQVQMPRAVSDVQIDRVASPQAIEAQLAELERLAKANGVAVGFIEAQNPVSIERVAAWTVGLRDRGIVLAPLTAVAGRQPTR